MRSKQVISLAIQTGIVLITALMLVNGCKPLDHDPRTVESTPALFLHDADLPEGWVVTSPPTKPRPSASDYAVSLIGLPDRSRKLPAGRLEIGRARSAEDASRHYDGQMNLPLQYTQLPDGFAAYPYKADAYRLGCDSYQIYFHCLYKARYGQYTVELAVTLNPATAATDLAKMISAIERRVGSVPR